MVSVPDPRCAHARLTPDGITQRCVLDRNHEGPHLDQSVQRVWWVADSDVGQPAGEPPVADREPADDVELVDPATARRRYYAKVSGIVEGYQRAARLNQSRNDWLQWLVIGFSAVTTALAGIAAAVADWRVRIAPIVTSAVRACFRPLVGSCCSSCSWRRTTHRACVGRVGRAAQAAGAAAG